MKAKSFLTALCVALIFPAGLLAQADVRANAEVRVNLKRVRINYGRPALEGRDSREMLDRAPAGTVWRVGMNEATEISSTADLNVGGKHLAAGRYSLWVRKLSKDKWSLSFHPKTDILGLPELTEGFVAEAPMELSQVSTFNDRLLIVLDTNGKDTVEIAIYWGSSKFEGTIEVID